MTVVEAYGCGRKIDPPDSSSELPDTLTSLLIEGIALNANGCVFIPEVSLYYFYFCKSYYYAVFSKKPFIITIFTGLGRWRCRDFWITYRKSNP